MAFSGLTGAGKVALSGGAPTAPPLPAGNPAMIVADNATLKDLTESARGTLGEIDRVINDNADSLHGAIASIETFAGALARNADKVDAIVNGLAQLTGGGAATNYALHDLPAPAVAKAAAVPDGQLVVLRPTALVALSTQRILIADANGDVPVFDVVRFADYDVAEGGFVTSLEDIEADVRHVSLPLDEAATSYRVLAQVSQGRDQKPADLQAKGWTRFSIPWCLTTTPAERSRTRLRSSWPSISAPSTSRRCRWQRRR